MGFKKWKPSKAQATEFKKQMEELDTFLAIHPNIYASASKNSFYFTIDNKKYRVSNHTIEASNARAFNFLGQQVRDTYHPNGREADTIYIHASKIRLIEVYTNIEKGLTIDGRGYPV